MFSDGPNQKAIDDAIDKGAKALLQRAEKGYGKVDPQFAEAEVMTHDEIVLFTLIHAGVKENDSGFQAVLERILKAKMERTYDVSFKACALEALDPVKYRLQIAQCAQFLIDNQCKNGQWYYSNPVPLPPVPIPTSGAREPKKTLIETSGQKGGSGAAPPAASGGGSDAGAAPKRSTDAIKNAPKIAIPRRGWGGNNGDNSNTQYAILGLMACQKAGCAIPPEVFALTEQWAQQSQRKSGAWGYDEKEIGKDETGSMSCGIGGSLAAILVSLHKFREPKEAQKDARVAGAAKWIGEKFTPTTNPGGGALDWHFYYLYATERAGAFMGTDTFGAHDWYAEGATWLLANQKGDGAWGDGRSQTADTCFAILFLKRATRKLSITYTGGK